MDLFNIGFITVRLIDIVDILIITYVIYKLYMIMKGTIAFQIFIALLLILGFSVLAQVLNMQAVGWLLSRLTDIWVIAFIILFQPEIRRVLSIIGKTRFARLFLKIDIYENVNEVVEACLDLQKKGWGGLIVISRTSGLQNVEDTGEKLHAKINKELIISIFNPKSPLHDGAVIIHNNKIEAARCVLPLTEMSTADKRLLGTRHRAGIGITEVSDAIAIIISEETKRISIAEDGKLHKAESRKDLEDKLKDVMGSESVVKTIKEVFEKPSSSKKKNQEKKKEES
ncbi:MAG: TIGR00159 family protein [Ignavibacteria bacterium]|nr:TIGR00159 family protein [Ignavibacteria bacterium]